EARLIRPGENKEGRRAARRLLIDLLHGRLLVEAVLLEGREVVHVRVEVVLVVVDRETELDEAVDTRREGRRLVEREARRQERRVVEQPDEVLDRLVRLVGLGLVAERLDDGVQGVDLHGLLRRHVGRRRRVAQGLGLHDALHVRGPAVLARDEDARRVGEARRDDDLVDLVVEDLLHELAEALGGGLGLLELLLLLLGLLHLEALLRGREELLALVLLELLDAVLVHGVGHEDDLVALLLELLEEGRRLDGALRLAGHVVDARLVVRHARDVVVERRLLLARLRRVVSQQLGDLRAVRRVLVDAELQILVEGLVELLVLVLVLRDLVEELDGLLDQILLDDLEDLVLLQRLARDVEREVLGINNTLDKRQELGHEVLAVVHDEDAAHVQLDVVELLLVAALEHVEGRAARHEEHRAELELALDREVLDRGVVLPVVRERLVEGGVLLLRHLVGLAHPDGLLAVEVVPLVRHLLDLLRLLLLLRLGLVDVLDLRGVVVLVALLLVVIVVVRDLLLLRLLDVELDREADELRVLLHEVLEAALLEVLGHVLLHREDDARAAADALGLGRVRRHRERAAGRGLPRVLLVVVRLGRDDDLLRDEVRGVEADAELADHGDVRAGLERLHEGLRAGLGDRAEVVDEVGLGHADARVDDGQGVVGLVGHDVDLEVRLGVEDRRVRERLVADLVERIGGVRDELAEEDLLVRVERVDDQREELVDVGREGEGLDLGGHFCKFFCLRGGVG
ncbi:unnamed protein product, partial [Pelagomonas calceolata]